MGAEKSKRLKEEDIQHLQATTNFSGKELKKIYKQYRKLGTLNRENFMKIIQESFPGSNDQEFCDYVFRVYDENGDGLIDFEEFVCSINIAAHGTPHQKLSRAFRLYDLNDDGAITQDEATEVIHKILSAAGATIDVANNKEAVKEFFDKLDTDGDGRVTEKEFVQGADKIPGLIQTM